MIFTFSKNIWCRLRHRRFWQEKHTTYAEYRRYWCARCKITIYDKKGSQP